jgi:biopolymer transport protein ExbB
MSAIMNAKTILIVLVLIAGLAAARAQSEAESSEASFEEAAATVQQQLEEALAELNRLREQIAEEKIPLNRQLNDLEGELSDVRAEYQQTTRLLDSRTLDLSNLRSEIRSREEEATYLSNLLSDYVRNFETRLHIAEIHRYADVVEAARLAPENDNLSRQQVFEAQSKLVATSLDRLHEVLGGTRFDGTAVNPDGRVTPGRFVLIGPAALFRSDDGEHVGTVEEKLGSLEPTIVPFEQPGDSAVAASVVSGSGGTIPLDPTLGNAHVIATTKDTLVEHFQKGGVVMWPILALLMASLIVALFKFVGLFFFVRKPSLKRIEALVDAVTRGDRERAKREADAVRGPAGAMLTAGVAHIDEPRELIEEVMYEKMLATRLKLNRLLPFIAISAAAAPLMGLLGTVVGIINTFKLITVFGTGDVKTLSGGISEALITTEFGLIVAIFSLLLHAFLARRARGVVDQMEKAAVAFVNQVSRSIHVGGAPEPGRNGSDGSTAVEPAPAAPSAEQVREALSSLLAPVVLENLGGKQGAAAAASGSSEQERRPAAVGGEPRQSQDDG